MSKIGKKPIVIPEGVDIQLEGKLVKVKGPKWELSYKTLDMVKVEKKENEITVSIDHDDNKKFWGLTRTLIANMVEGVTNGYEKKLLVMGVWYGAKLQGKILELSIGYSHKVNYSVPEGIEVTTEQDPKGNTIITLKSIDKQKLGEVTAKIRAFKKPEPYKGKGIQVKLLKNNRFFSTALIYFRFIMTKLCLILRTS